MEKKEELTAKLMAMAQEFKQLQLSIAAQNSNAKTAFTKEEAQEINAKVNKFDAIKDKNQLDEVGKTLAEELKTLIPAFLAKYIAAPEAQQKQLASVKTKAESVMQFIGSLKTMAPPPNLKERVEQLGKDADALIIAVNTLKQQFATDQSKISKDELELLLIDIADYQKKASELRKTHEAELKTQKLDTKLADAESAFGNAKTDIEGIQKKLVIKRIVTPETLQKELSEFLAKGDSLLEETEYNEKEFTKLIGEISTWRKNNTESIEKSALKDLLDKQIADFKTAIENKKNRVVTNVSGGKSFTYEMPFVLQQIFKKETQTIFDYTIVFTFDKKMVNNEEFWAVSKAEFVGSQGSLKSAKELGNFNITENAPKISAQSMYSAAEVSLNLKRDGKMVPIFTPLKALNWITFTDNPLYEHPFIRIPAHLDVKINIGDLVGEALRGDCDVKMSIFISIDKVGGKHTVNVKVPDETIFSAFNFRKSLKYSCPNIKTEKDKAKLALESHFNAN